MYMKFTVSFCDASQKTYSSPKEGAVLLKHNGDGAWEIVSQIGPEYLEAQGIKPLSKEKCRMEIEGRGGFLLA